MMNATATFQAVNSSGALTAVTPRPARRPKHHATRWIGQMAAPKTIDRNGRCCGRKPIHYKRPAHLYCPRCNASFDVATGEQIANWAYRKSDDGFEPIYAHMKERLS